MFVEKQLLQSQYVAFNAVVGINTLVNPTTLSADDDSDGGELNWLGIVIRRGN